MSDGLVPLVDHDEDATEERGAERRHYDQISTHATKTAALSAMQHRDGLSYRYLYNQGTRSTTSVYECASHVDCPKRIRLAPMLDEGGHRVFSLEEDSNEHTDTVNTMTKKRGISPLYLPEVDAMLNGGAGPKKCRLLLTQKYKDDPKMIKLLPDELQLKNRKTTLKKAPTDNWSIQDVGTLLEWASTKMCKTAADFYGRDWTSEGEVPNERAFQQSVNGMMDALIVLHVFEDPAANAFGMIFTSRQAFLNLARSIRDQGEEVFASSDGTYRLHSGGWTLVNFGTYTTRYERGVFSKHFVPWTFMFVKSESELAYQTLFNQTRYFVDLFFNLDLIIQFGSLDHSAAIANAYRTEWPHLILLNCWPHVSRKAREQRTKLSDVSYFDDVIFPHIEWMHLCRTYAQFRAMGNKCINMWIDDGEAAYASWFKEVYFTAPWDTWYIGAAGHVCGVLPNQNAIESFHLTIKKAIPSKRASTSVVLNNNFPVLLLLVGEDVRSANLATKSFQHYAQGPIPADQFVRARILLSDTHNYMRMVKPGEKVVRSILFNAEPYLNSPTNPHRGVNVTVTRANRYTAGLNGDLDERKPATDAPLLYMSLHKVDVLAADHANLQNRPEWEQDEIGIVRRSYGCDCKTVRQSGWIGEHILAAMSLLEKIDLDDVLRAIPVRRKPGRPRKSRGALGQDNTGSHFFSVDNLIKMLTNKPGYIFHWSVMKEFTLASHTTKKNEFIAGRVTGWQINRGRYAWSVRFTDGQVVEMQCQEMAELLSFSHEMGLNVDGLPQ